MSMPPSTLISASGAYGGCRSGTSNAALPARVSTLVSSSSLFIEHRTQQLEVLPGDTCHLRASQQIGGMIGDHERGATIRMDAPAQPADTAITTGEQLRREFTHRQQYLRCNRLQLAVQVIRA